MLKLPDYITFVNIAAGLFCIAVPNAITKTASFAKAHVVLESLEGIHLDDILRMVSVGDG